MLSLRLLRLRRVRRGMMGMRPEVRGRGARVGEDMLGTMTTASTLRSLNSLIIPPPNPPGGIRCFPPMVLREMGV